MNKVAIVLGVVAVFGAGYFLADTLWERDFAEFKLKAEKDYSALLEKKLEADKQNREQVSRLESEYLTTINEQKQSYEKTIADIRRNFKPSGVSKCPSSGDGVPRADSDTSELVCYRRADLQHKIEQSLAITRDADRLAVKYNTLLNMVKKND